MNTEFNNHAFGCLPSKKDLRDYRLDKKVAYSVLLPPEFEVPHSPIKNQGNVCSCVAHSVAEVLEAMNKNKEKYSTNWVYGYRPKGYYVGPGMMTRQACQTVIELGYLTYDDFPGNTEMLAVMRNCNSKLKQLQDKASERKAVAYNRLRTKTQIKEAIYTSGLPVLVVIKIPDKVELDDEFILQYDENHLGGCHCMVCYGWNELGLLIQNSWGESWGNKGTCILPEEYPVVEAWAISCESHVNISARPKNWGIRNFIQKIIKLFRK